MMSLITSPILTDSHITQLNILNVLSPGDNVLFPVVLCDKVQAVGCVPYHLALTLTLLTMFTNFLMKNSDFIYGFNVYVLEWLS